MGPIENLDSCASCRREIPGNKWECPYCHAPLCANCGHFISRDECLCSHSRFDREAAA